MRSSYLVQRLKRPTKRPNPFAFGGGYLHGGLTEEAAEMVYQIMSFDYMGSAEFEFGALPEAFRRMAQQQLDVRIIEIAEDDVAPPPSYRTPIEPIEDHTYDGTLVLIGAKDDLDEIETRIRTWATEPFNPKLKESTRLASALRPSNRWDIEIVGWFELDNGFMFFTDREMADNVTQAFGIAPDDTRHTVDPQAQRV